MKIILPDNIERDVEIGSLPLDLAKSISQSLARNSTGVIVGDRVRGLQEPFVATDENKEVRFVGLDSKEGQSVYWHSSSHVMALAIQRLFPNVKFAIGPAIDGGFYYDLDSEHRFNDEDFSKIEKEMKNIAKENLLIERQEISRDDALKLFSDLNQDYKIEIISELPEDEIITVYKIGEFVDLCRGPHLTSTKRIKASKILSVAGAYWKGDEKNKVLQRLYAVSFEKESQLEEHLLMLKDRKERDHRKLGKDLDLFLVSSEVGSGLPFWLPKGATIRRIIERYIIDKELERGYQHVYTPVLANVNIYKTSGHWDHYRSSMFPPMDMGDGEMLVLRPMNCPHHMTVYKNSVHSYRELPIRIAELGMMHRYEKSGELSGLQRVREMTLNDSHIFVRPDQIADEFKKVLELILEVYKDFNINEYEFRLSYRDPKNTEKYFDDDEMWNVSQRQLKETMDSMKLEYYEAEGEAAFYGPKLDIQVKTNNGLSETLSTIQLDFLLPQKFDLTYVGEDGKNDHRPVVIHRGVVSTMERFTAHLIETYKGAFPTWLAPVQIEMIPVNLDLHSQKVEDLKSKWSKYGLRIETDLRNEKLGKKIREAQMMKIPYQLVFGDNELENSLVNVRKYGSTETKTMSEREFLDMVLEEIREHR